MRGKRCDGRVRLACWLAAALAVCALWNSAPAEAADCSAAHGRRILFLIDRTDPYSDQDAARLKNGAGMVMQALREGDQIEIKTIVGDAASSQLLFDGCLISCEGPFCSHAETDRQNAEFYQDYAKAFTDLLGYQQDDDHSAIIETIHTLAKRSKPSDLIIFSDFRENTKNLDTYKPDPKRFSAYRQKLKADYGAGWLGGVAVTGFGFKKPLGNKGGKFSDKQWAEVQRFWIGLFIDSGAKFKGLSADFPGADASTSAQPAPTGARP